MTIRADFICPEHGIFEADVPCDDEFAPCPEWVSAYEGESPDDGVPCREFCRWVPSPVRGRVRLAEVERGGVEQAASPMYLSTRELGEGMPYEEFRAKRDKMYEERRHKESKDL